MFALLRPRDFLSQIYVVELRILRAIPSRSSLHYKLYLVRMCIIYRLKRSKIRVILGDHDQTVINDSESVMRAVSSIVRHRHFDANSYNHDIALLKLRKPVTFSKNVRPVCLPPEGSYTMIEHISRMKVLFVDHTICHRVGSWRHERHRRRLG